MHNTSQSATHVSKLKENKHRLESLAVCMCWHKYVGFT